jgi:hypothetical protein
LGKRRVAKKKKLLDIQSKPNGKVYALVENVHGILKETDFLESAYNFLVIIVP